MSIQNVGRNKWRVIVKTGVNPETGKPRYIDRIITGTKENAQNFEAKVFGMGGAASATMIFGEYITGAWLPSLKVQASTKEQHEYALKHLKALYPVKLSMLTAREIENAIHDLPPGNIRHRARKTLSVALNAAVRWDVLPYNPLAKAKISIGDGPERKYEAYGVEELRAVLAAFRDDKAEAVVVIMAFCGLSREEALALDWEDIDLESGSITISKAWVLNGGRPILKKPKNTWRERTSYIDGWGLERLREIAGEGALWPGVKYDHITPGSAYKYYERKIKAAGLRYIPLNHLRHTRATLALSVGIDVAVVSKDLGHRRISTTVDRYIKPLEKAKEEAAGTYAQMMGGFQHADNSRKTPENYDKLW